jgi:hypothetical protein
MDNQHHLNQHQPIQTDSKGDSKRWIRSPFQREQPLARWSVPELERYARDHGLVATIRDSTLWRWLHGDAIRPWQHHCWIFPRDPNFETKARRLLDLYERIW